MTNGSAALPRELLTAGEAETLALPVQTGPAGSGAPSGAPWQVYEHRVRDKSLPEPQGQGTPGAGGGLLAVMSLSSPSPRCSLLMHTRG